MSDAQDVHALIAAYLTAWNAREFDGMAALFAEPNGMMGPDGMGVIPDRAALAAGLAKRFEAMDADGFDHTEIERVDVQMCSDALAIAHLINLRRLRADGSVQGAFDSFYVCARTAEGWRLTLGAACDLGWFDRPVTSSNPV